MFNKDFNTWSGSSNFNIVETNQMMPGVDSGFLEYSHGSSIVVEGSDRSSEMLILENSSNFNKIKNIHSSEVIIGEGKVIFRINIIDNKIQSSISFLDSKFESVELINRLFDDIEKTFHDKTNCLLKEKDCSLEFSYLHFKNDPLLEKDTWEAVKGKIKKLKVVYLKLEECVFENKNPLEELHDAKIKGKLLSFEYCEPDPNAIINLGKFLKINIWLKKFSLKNVDYSEEAMSPLFSTFCDSLGTCKNLEELELDNSTFSKSQLDSLFKTLGGLKNLKKLSLSDMFCSSDRQLISKLNWDLIYSQSNSLEEVDLSCNSFDAEMMLDLLNTNTPGLKRINFCSTDLIGNNSSKNTFQIIHDLTDRLKEKGLHLILEEDVEEDETGGFPAQPFMGNYNSFLFQQQSEEITKRNLKNKELIEGILNNEIITLEMLKEAFSADYGHPDLTQQNLDSLFIHLLEKKGFEKGEAPRDGACLFHSLAKIVNKEMGVEVFLSHFLRSEMINYMRNNSTEFEEFTEDNAQYEEYLEKMSLDTTWGGDMEIKALAFYFGRSIILYDLDTYTLSIKSGIDVLGKDNKLKDLECLRYDPLDGDSGIPLHIHRSNGHFSPLYLNPPKNLAE